ncbi:hypothetical protein BGZ47_004508 [Haplosporangium gracile]|nr:hypothetical protein BGZ47_004508 [Haplosporangium gracile]
MKTLAILRKLTRLKNEAVQLTLQTLLKLCPALQGYESNIHIDIRDEHLTTVSPHVRILTIRRSQIQISALFNVFLQLCNLEQLTSSHLISSDSPDWCSGTVLGGAPSRLKDLHFTHTELPKAESLILALTAHILSGLPHLTALSVKVFESRTAAVLASCCPLLESVKLFAVLKDLYDVDTVTTLLYNCPKLKILDTIRYSVDAESLLERPIIKEKHQHQRVYNELGGLISLKVLDL